MCISKLRKTGCVASDFLYWSPPKGGLPDSTLRIGVDFEVGGTYEDWGFVVYKKVFSKKRDSYYEIEIAQGRTLKIAVDKARKVLKEMG